MPRTRRNTRRDDMPSTVARSDAHAQATYTKVHDSAVDTYGEGARAHRTAFAALKHGYEKVGDHWERKDTRGPSDDHAAGPGSSSAPTAGGVDARASKQHLLDVARRLDVRGRSRMTKSELVEAIRHANDRATATARRG